MTQDCLNAPAVLSTEKKLRVLLRRRSSRGFPLRSRGEQSSCTNSEEKYAGFFLKRIVLNCHSDRTEALGRASETKL